MSNYVDRGGLFLRTHAWSCLLTGAGERARARSNLARWQASAAPAAGGPVRRANSPGAEIPSQ